MCNLQIGANLKLNDDLLQLHYCGTDETYFEMTLLYIEVIQSEIAISVISQITIEDTFRENLCDSVTCPKSMICSLPRPGVCESLGEWLRLTPKKTSPPHRIFSSRHSWGWALYIDGNNNNNNNNASSPYPIKLWLQIRLHLFSGNATWLGWFADLLMCQSQGCKYPWTHGVAEGLQWHLLT